MNNDNERDSSQEAVDFPRPAKRFISTLADIVSMVIALWAASALKRGTWTVSPVDWPAYLTVVLISIPIFVRLGLYRAVIRFLGHKAVFAVALAVALSAVLLGALGHFLQIALLSPSIVAIYSCLSLLYVTGSRFMVRYYLMTRDLRPTIARVAIYGAGEAGARLSGVLMSTRAFDPLAFIDDKRSLHGRLVNGLKVHSPGHLPELISKLKIDRVLLAMPTLSRQRRLEILRQLEPLGVHVQTVPQFEQLVTGSATVDEIGEVDVCDLLGRDAVPPKPDLFSACIRDRVVLVTGAGGSIGSELCRQIIGLSPKRLILLEISELALYNVERELRTLRELTASGVDIVGLIGNAHHKARVKEVLKAYRVQTIYHAAAYKHVPIVEQNVIEGVYNNLVSTWYTAEAAHETEVETFVLVSTDKAVNPTNVMGATKRFAEIVLQALHNRGTKTRFCMVRFGNVLASSGSVVPLFYEQIKQGGPVTVTHPDVIRYFMTITEAAQLVIQAGSMAKGGDVFVLDMGKPVRIGDLARRMIHLSGLTVRDELHPDGDIEISYTGLRPAEKLFEELLIGNNVTGTEHPMILRAMEHSLPWDRVAAELEKILLAMNSSDCQLVLKILTEVVAEYKPALLCHDLVWQRQAMAALDDKKVTSLKSRRLVRNSGMLSPMEH